MTCQNWGSTIGPSFRDGPMLAGHHGRLPGPSGRSPTASRPVVSSDEPYWIGHGEVVDMVPRARARRGPDVQGRAGRHEGVDLVADQGDGGRARRGRRGVRHPRLTGTGDPGEAEVRRPMRTAEQHGEALAAGTAGGRGLDGPAARDGQRRR